MMSNEYRDKHLLDVSGGEVLPPDYQQHLDQPMVIPDYEEWAKQLESSIHELDEQGGRDEQRI